MNPKYVLYWQARLVELQGQVLEITMALADLRARQEIAKDMETAIAMEISRREEAEKRKEIMAHFKPGPFMFTRGEIALNALC